MKIRNATNQLFELALENVKNVSPTTIAGGVFKEFMSFVQNSGNCGPDVTPDACRAYNGGKAILLVADLVGGVGAAKALLKGGKAVVLNFMKRMNTMGRQLRGSSTVGFALSLARKGLDIFVNGYRIGTHTERGIELANRVENIGARIAKAENVEVYNPNTKRTEVGDLEVDAQGRCKFGPKCFVAGTPVYTRQGIRPIERIKPGDEVLSRDETTGQQTYKRVVRTFIKTATRLTKVFTGIDTILTTPEHPFRVGQRWVGAGELHKGDALHQAEVATAANVPYLPRSGLEVDSIATLDTTATVYNLEVADFHTYFVGRQGVWVHNSCLSFPQISMKISTIDRNGQLAGRYVNGILHNTSNANLAQTWDYVVTTNGEILIGRKHSFLSDGNDVLAAGEIKFRNREIVDINNASGHYLPTPNEASNFLRIFRNQGVNVDKATLTILGENGTIFRQITPNHVNRASYY